MSVPLTERLGTKAVVAGGLGIVGIGLGGFTSVGVETEYLWKIAAILVSTGFGMGLAMAPATDAIMGSLPQTKAGIGSAMNDVVREVGGTLGVAVLASIVSTGYVSGMDGSTAGLPDGAAEAASDSVGGAHQVAAELGGGAAAKLVAVADQSFIDAMTTAAGVATVVALVGAVVAALFLPSRAGAEDSTASAPAPAPAAA